MHGRDHADGLDVARRRINRNVGHAYPCEAPE
jgi:hypothetical protein